MKKLSTLLYYSTWVLVILSTGFLLFNMMATLMYRQQIFFERDMLSTVEIVIAIGFGFILEFDIVSFLWVVSGIRRSQKVTGSEIGTLILGGSCLILLLGEKAMIDEIGREYLLRWEVLGEWIILYVFLTIQLLYNLVILQKLFRTLNK